MDHDNTYLALMRRIYDEGERKDDRTGVGTLSLFGEQLRFDLRHVFPLLTTKKVWWRGTVEELRWILSGSTNVRDLHPRVQKWWTPWAREDGDLGEIYGYQMRRAGGVDQLAHALDQLQNNPDSRRIVINLWNTPSMVRAALPCCHGAIIQFGTHMEEGRRVLNCHMYQRSADYFIGVPVNIASYALFTRLVAHALDYDPGDLIISFGDVHLYLNHLDQVEQQLRRRPRDAPTLRLEMPRQQTPLDTVLSLTYDNAVIYDYHPYPALKAPVAV